MLDAYIIDEIRRTEEERRRREESARPRLRIELPEGNDENTPKDDDDETSEEQTIRIEW